MMYLCEIIQRGKFLLERGAHKRDALLIVTEGNPLENLQALRNVSVVVTGGKIIDHPKVKKMPQVEQELDKFL